MAEGLDESPLKRFYQSIARSEERHYTLFLKLAGRYFDPQPINQRWDELLDVEAGIVAGLPVRAALH